MTDFHVDFVAEILAPEEAKQADDRQRLSKRKVLVR